MSVLTTCYVTISRNKTGNIVITQPQGAFVQQSLQGKSKKYPIKRVCVCSLRYATCNVQTPFYHVTCTALHQFYILQWTLELRRPDIRTTLVKNRMPVKAKTCIRLCGCKQRPRDAFVSVSLSPDKRVCGRNFGQCSALHN
jgi:hypothetical protein